MHTSRVLLGNVERKGSGAATALETEVAGRSDRTVGSAGTLASNNNDNGRSQKVVGEEEKPGSKLLINLVEAGEKDEVFSWWTRISISAFIKQANTEDGFKTFARDEYIRLSEVVVVHKDLEQEWRQALAESPASGRVQALLGSQYQ